MDKPFKPIRGWFVTSVNGTLKVGERAKLLLLDGSFIETSPIVQLSYAIVETENSVYKRYC